MARIALYFLSFLCGFFVFDMIFVLPVLNFSDWRLRENGEWFNFGPAVISSCKCEKVIIVFDSYEDQKVITDASNIDTIKNWIIQSGIDRRYCYSPTIPIGVGVAKLPHNTMLLYDSTQADDENALIIAIPLNPLTLGVSRNGCSAKIEEIKRLVQ